MWLLLVCSIAALAVFGERLLYFHRISIHVGEFLQGLSNLIRKENYAEALHECAGTPGPVARVIHAAVIRHDSPREELKSIVQEAGQLEVPKLERNLAILHTIAQIAPLLGLLGTVSGMISAFSIISAQSGYATATDLSSAIYQSLLTTAAGLAVGIPAWVAHNFLSTRVNTVVHDMERGGIEIVSLLTEPRSGGEIIKFETRRRSVAD